MATLEAYEQALRIEQMVDFLKGDADSVMLDEDSFLDALASFGYVLTISEDNLASQMYMGLDEA